MQKNQTPLEADGAKECEKGQYEASRVGGLQADPHAR